MKTFTKRRIAMAMAIASCAIAIVVMYFMPHPPKGDTATTLPTPGAPSVLAAGDEPTAPILTAPPQPTTSRTPKLDNLSPLARYDRLAASTNPADNKIAYDMVQRCRDTKWAGSANPELVDFAREECGDLVMRPGILDDPAKRIPLITRAAEAGVHRACLDLYRYEYKRGNLPPGPETEALLQRCHQTALSTADPWALAEESKKAALAGNKVTELELFVAYRTALARDRGDHYDPSTDNATLARAKALPDAEATSAIARGTQYVALAYKSQK